jgi:hypothetical protein
MKTKLLILTLTLAFSASAHAASPLVKVDRTNARSGETDGCTLYDDGSITMTREGVVYGGKNIKAAIKVDEVRAESFEGLVSQGYLELSKGSEEKFGQKLYWPNRDKLKQLISEADAKSPMSEPKERKNLLRGIVNYVGYAGGQEIPIKHEWTEAKADVSQGRPVTFGRYRHGDNIAALIDIADAACRSGLRKATYILNRK